MDKDIIKNQEPGKVIELKTRVEMLPAPPSQLDRIERMLKWAVIQKKLEENHQDRLTAGEMQNKERFEQCVENWRGLKKQLPDISDIIKVP